MMVFNFLGNSAFLYPVSLIFFSIGSSILTRILLRSLDKFENLDILSSYAFINSTKVMGLADLSKFEYNYIREISCSVILSKPPMIYCDWRNFGDYQQYNGICFISSDYTFFELRNYRKTILVCQAKNDIYFLQLHTTKFLQRLNAFLHLRVSCITRNNIISNNIAFNIYVLP